MIHHLSYSSGNLQLDLPHHHANQFRPRKVIRSLVVAWGLPRLLTLPRIVQQAASVCFDNCDPFSFLPFEGDLVMGKVNDSSFTLKEDSQCSSDTAAALFWIVTCCLPEFVSHDTPQSRPTSGSKVLKGWL